MTFNYHCYPDHNGECLVCDCWLENCAYDRWVNKDFTYESEEELNKMFNNEIQESKNRTER